MVIAVNDHPLADEIGFAEMTARDVEVLPELPRDAIQQLERICDHAKVFAQPKE